MSNFSSASISSIRGPPIRAVRSAELKRPISGPTSSSSGTNASIPLPSPLSSQAPMFNFGNGGGGFGGAPPSEQKTPAFDFPAQPVQSFEQRRRIEDPWNIINSISTMNSRILSKEQTLDYTRAVFWLQVSLRSQGIATQVLDYFYLLFARAEQQDPERMLQIYLLGDLIFNDDMRSAIFSHPQFQQIFIERLNTLVSPLVAESLNRGERIANQTFEQEYASTLGFRGDEPGKPDLLGKRMQQFFDLFTSPISPRRTWPMQAAAEPAFEAESFFP